MKIFQNYQKTSEILGIYPPQSSNMKIFGICLPQFLQKTAFHPRNVVALYFVGQCTIASGAYFFFEANTFAEYVDSFYEVTTTAAIAFDLFEIIRNATQIFVLFKDFEGTIEKSELKFAFFCFYELHRKNKFVTDCKLH